MPAPAHHSAVAAPLGCVPRPELAPERDQVDATTVMVKRIDRARLRCRHVTVTAGAHGHHAAPRWRRRTSWAFEFDCIVMMHGAVADSSGKTIFAMSSSCHRKDARLEIERDDDDGETPCEAEKQATKRDARNLRCALIATNAAGEVVSSADDR